MQIYFGSMTLPKKAAKRIQKHFTPAHEALGSPMSLHEAQRITSLMLGYGDWHELEQMTKATNHPPSQLDEETSEEEQGKRLTYQTKVLEGIFPQTYPVLREFTLKFRVSAGAPFSSMFAEDGFRQNTLIYWEPYGENPEWRFRPSARSEQKRDELYDLLDQWGRGVINLGEYQRLLDRVIESQPENIVPYLYMIEAAGDVHAWEAAAPYLPRLEAAIIQSLPPDYPMKRKVPPLMWGTLDNRDYLRSLYHLAMGYYADGNYKKAKQWFLFLTRCSEIEMGYEKNYLADLRRGSPEGDVHIIMSKA